MLRLMRVPTFAAATRTSRAATHLALGPPKQLSLFSSKVASLAEQREDAEQPAAPRLVITDRCVQRILQLNRKVDDPTLQRLLRVSVEPGGCSGFQYRFELEEPSNVEADDAVIEKEGAQVVIDGASLELVAGSTIDFEDEMMKSAFMVTDNPQSSASCGCGTSFVAKDLF